MTDRQTERELTGYPSIDKPWLKYYKNDVQNKPLPDVTLYEYVWQNNKDHLNDTALVYFGTKINYRTFFMKVENVAKALWSYGVREGDIVTIMSVNTPETVYSFYALNYIGAVANMVYMTLSEKEIVEVLSNTKSKLIMALGPSIEKIHKVKDKILIPVVILPIAESMPLYLKTIVKLKSSGKKQSEQLENEYAFKDFINKNIAADSLKKAVEPEAVATIVYTSGTTGEPKGVCLTNNNLNSMAFQDINGLVEFKRGKDCLLYVPPFTGYGISQLHILLSTGVCTILQIRPDPETVVKSFLKYKPYCFLTGPSRVLTLLANSKPRNLSSVRYFFGGGGGIPEKQEEDLNTFFAKCNSEAFYSNGYGMTETSSILCLNVNEYRKKESVGIPFVLTNIQVRDVDTGEEKKFGEVGELWFQSPSIMKGYFNKPEATSEVISLDNEGNRWIRTGDLGYVDEDGFVFLKGRIKRIFPTRGSDNNAYKIFPQRIEDLYSTVNWVKACGV